MGKSLILFLFGVPIPIIIILYFVFFRRMKNSNAHSVKGISDGNH